MIIQDEAILFLHISRVSRPMVVQTTHWSSIGSSGGRKVKVSGDSKRNDDKCPYNDVAIYTALQPLVGDPRLFIPK